jgi:hypothetical protein
MSCHEGEEMSKEEDRDSKRRSELGGADEYEYELYWSVFPPWTNRASFITTVA